MKKLFSVLILAVVTGMCLSAQNVSCHFGVQTGLSVNSFKASNLQEFKSQNMTGWQAGATLLVKLPAYFSIQPTIQFDRVWMKVPGETIKQSVLDVPVPIQWGPDLGIIRPYVQAVPFVDFSLGANARNDMTEIWQEARDWFSTAQFGIGVGAGLEIWKLQLNFRYNWALGNWADLGKIPLDTTLKDYLNGRKNGFIVTLAFFFN